MFLQFFKNINQFNWKPCKLLDSNSATLEDLFKNSCSSWAKTWPPLARRRLCYLYSSICGLLYRKRTKQIMDSQANFHISINVLISYLLKLFPKKLNMENHLSWNLVLIQLRLQNEFSLIMYICVPGSLGSTITYTDTSFWSWNKWHKLEGKDLNIFHLECMV